MKVKPLLKSWALSTTRNLTQFLIGLALYVTISLKINPFNLVFGLASFMITYLAVYLFNDLMDFKEDKRKVKEIKEKGRYKPLVFGHMSQNDAVSLMFLLLIIGLVLASFVNFVFATILFVSLFMNFFYSSNWFKFRKTSWKLSIVMLIAQASKYSLGWFSQTEQFNMFPFWPIMMLSLVYIFFLLVYKAGGNYISVKELKKVKRRGKKMVIVVIILLFISFTMTLLLHPLEIPLFIAILAGVLSPFISKKVGFDKRIESQNMIVGLIGIVFVLSILLFALNPKLSLESERVEAFSESLRQNMSQVFLQNSELLWDMITRPQDYSEFNVSVITSLKELEINVSSLNIG